MCKSRGMQIASMPKPSATGFSAAIGGNPPRRSSAWRNLGGSHRTSATRTGGATDRGCSRRPTLQEGLGIVQPQELQYRAWKDATRKRVDLSGLHPAEL
jgi:hypothetical protein